MDAALVAGLDHQQGVGTQEVRSHGDAGAIRHHGLGVAREFLDEAEDVIPAPAIEAGGMIAQLVEDLVHLERGEDGLDQHRRLDGALGQTELRLREQEHLVPQPRFQMRFQLRQIEIGAGAARRQLLRVVEEIESEIEQAARHRPAVDRDVLLRQVPAARPHQQHGGLLVEAIGLAAAAIVECDLAAHGVHQVALAVELVGPGRRGRILEIRHVAGGAGIERVDHHLAIDRAGDLGPAVEQILGQRRHLPVAGADLRGLLQEIRLLAGIEPLLPFLARLEQAQALRAELALELHQEGQGLVGQDLLECGIGQRGNGNTGQSHFRFLQPINRHARGTPRRSSHPCHAGPRPGNPYFGRGRSADDARRHDA